MKCYNHPDVDAVGTCVSCGKAVCRSCCVDVAGKTVCQSCLAAGNTPETRSPSKPYNPLSFISLVLAIIGLITCPCYGVGALLFGIPASIVGFVARKQISASNSSQEGLSIANVGFWMGICEIVVGFLVLLCLVLYFGVGVFTALLQQSGQ